ncbi:MAG TPA: PLP-dependent aminotransferase family protein [Thermoguttaceae bacterium]|nr:PLP-dependent aminotransferase family protein [Thermoguttaceae bacterium]
MPEPVGFSRRARWAGGEPIANLLMARTLAQPELISLAAGFVDYETLPVGPTRQGLDAIFSDPDRARAALQYGTTIGYLPLREAILERMLHADGQTAREANVSVKQVVLTAGSNQLLHLVGDALLDPGDVVLCGAPSYFVFLGTLANLGARSVGVEIDEHGVIPEALEEELARLEAAGELGRVKAIYVTTYYDNPSGVTVPAERRGALVEIARRWSRHGKIYLIEDAAYRELRYYGDDVPSLRSVEGEADVVIHAGTFSKSFSPGIRVGWGILPPELIEPVLAQKGNIDFGSPNVNQHLMAAVLQMGLYDEHLERLRDGYRAKIDATLGAADEFLAGIDGVHWVRPEGGLYVWLQLPDSIDTGLCGPLFDRAVEEGVLYVPGEYCYPGDGRLTKKNMLRLSFGIQSCESIHRGVEALARAVGQVL